MNKEAPTIHQAHFARVAFIEKAVAAGTLGRIRASERNQDIALMYYLGEKSGKELGEVFPKPSGQPLTRASISIISRNVLREMIRDMENSQSLPPDPEREQILTRRENPLSKTLREREIQIPLFANPYDDFAQKAEKETDDQKLQEMLDSHSYAFFRKLARYKDRQGKRVIIPLSEVIRTAGYYPKLSYLKFFAESIEKSIPMRIIQKKYGREEKTLINTYYIVFSKHQQRITEIIQNDPNLQRFRGTPVIMVCGTHVDKTPTTTELFKQKGCSRNLLALAREAIGFRPSGNHAILLSDLLRDCPIPVYTMPHYSGYFYPTDRAEEIKVFLRSKYLASQGESLQS